VLTLPVSLYFDLHKLNQSPKKKTRKGLRQTYLSSISYLENGVGRGGSRNFIQGGHLLSFNFKL
jgi:hypothetical protein